MWRSDFMWKRRCLRQGCLVGLREAVSHRALEGRICGGPCLKELRAVHSGRRAGTMLPCSATGLICPACWERKCCHTDESTGFGKNFHPMVLKALFKCGGGGLVAKSCLTPVIPWTHGARQAPLSMGFSRQEYWGVAISFFRGSSWLRTWTQVSCTAGRWFTS